jgi:hypothetical protein
MAIKVIGAGLGRTGTLSLKMALEELGFVRCYHMVELFTNGKHVRVWDLASRGEPIDWDALFEGYQATVDWPGCAFYAELMRRYPEAKVVLTVRDPERWYESSRQTIYYVRNAFPGWMRLLLPRMRVVRRMLDRVAWNGMFQGRFDDKEFTIDVFNRYNEQVRRVVPPERLLVYEVREGWEPLCAFLGVPVPDGKPFPHVNDAAEFRARVRRGVRIVRTGGYTILVIVALILAWLASRILT